LYVVLLIILNILKKQLHTQIIAVNQAQANAIKDPIRCTIIKMLFCKELTTEQIFKQLNSSGFKKSISNTRHHLNILKNSHLVDITKIKQIRGTVIKFYTSRALLFDFNIPNNFDSNYEKIINRISVKLEKILNELMTQKSYCNFKTKNEDYNKFIIVEIINSALLNILYKK